MKFLLLLLLTNASAQNVDFEIKNPGDAVLATLYTIGALPNTEIDNHSIAEIKKTLSPFKILKGNFEQSKKIKIIKNPLKSYGTFTLANSRGLLWRTSRPMISTIRISKDDIASISEGKKIIFVSMKDQPALQVIGKILFAIFSADVDELQRHFQFSQVHTIPKAWSATLKPNDSNVAKIINYIDISGGMTVRKLTLFETNGDSTTITFQKVIANGHLTKEEEALFE